MREDRLVKLTCYVFLWSRPGMDDALIAYEDSVLAWVSEHGGTVLQRARSDGRDGRPLEIQCYEWPSRGAMAGYLSDPRRGALSTERDRVVAGTEVVAGQSVWRIGGRGGVVGAAPRHRTCQVRMFWSSHQWENAAVTAR
jgi:hypothetical protein